MNDVNTASSFVEITNYGLYRLQSWLQHKETKDQKKGKQPIEDDQPDQNLCSAVVKYTQCRKNVIG